MPLGESHHSAANSHALRPPQRCSLLGKQLGGIAKPGFDLRYTTISIPAEALWTPARVCPLRSEPDLIESERFPKSR